MKLQKIASLKDTRQDGAVNNGYLFSFDHRGICTVYEMEKLINGVAEAYAEFVLDKNDLISPHSNSVAFGKDYFDENDEFPLLLFCFSPFWVLMPLLYCGTANMPRGIRKAPILSSK